MRLIIFLLFIFSEYSLACSNNSNGEELGAFAKYEFENDKASSNLFQIEVFVPYLLKMRS
jgi:hypothetical protein